MNIKKILVSLFVSFICLSQVIATEIDDPWEGMNRSVHDFNMKVDAIILKPVSSFYTENVNSYVREGVGNFFGNIRESKDALNLLLQGEFSDSANAALRVGINTTIGIAGIIDFADTLGIIRAPEEDFGQTLAVWGVGSGPYLVLPFLGPSSLRDTLGFWADISNMEAFSGIYNIDSRLKTSLNIVNERVKYDVVFKRLQDSDDSYDLFKTLYAQKRKFDIEGEEEIEF